MNGRLVAVAVLVALFGIGGTGCRTSHDGAEPLAAGAPTDGEPAAVEDSGKTLNGTYTLRLVQDDYAAQNQDQLRALKWTFSEDGRFQKQEPSVNRTSRSLEGTYVIGTHNELVLYIEKVDSQQLDSARMERYVMEPTGADGLKLRYDSAGIITLQRQ